MSLFVYDNRFLEIAPFNFTVGRKFPANQINFENYAITFNVSSNVELADVQEVLKTFSKIGDIT